MELSGEKLTEYVRNVYKLEKSVFIQNAELNRLHSAAQQEVYRLAENRKTPPEIDKSNLIKNALFNGFEWLCRLIVIAFKLFVAAACVLALLFLLARQIDSLMLSNDLESDFIHIWSTLSTLRFKFDLVEIIKTILSSPVMVLVFAISICAYAVQHISFVGARRP